jgi:hypothetical protein
MRKKQVITFSILVLVLSVIGHAWPEQREMEPGQLVADVGFPQKRAKWQH